MHMLGLFASLVAPFGLSASLEPCTCHAHAMHRPSLPALAECTPLHQQPKRSSPTRDPPLTPTPGPNLAGGFFASGIKRAYNLDDFASIIPGHGGVYDRVDCQLIMGLATQTYYVTFIHGPVATAGRVLALALTLPPDDLRALYTGLGDAMRKRGIPLR